MSRQGGRRACSERLSSARALGGRWGRAGFSGLPPTVRAVPLLLDTLIDDADLVGVASRVVGADLEPMYRSIGEELSRTTKQRFRDQKDPQGNPWVPLAESTLARKKEKLILTGRTKRLRAVTYRAAKDRVAVGPTVIYGRVHQLGIGARTALSSGQQMPAIPARPYVGLSVNDREEVRQIAADFYAGLVSP